MPILKNHACQNLDKHTSEAKLSTTDCRDFWTIEWHYAILSRETVV